MKYPGDQADIAELNQWWSQPPSELAASYDMTLEEIQQRAWTWYTLRAATLYTRGDPRKNFLALWGKWTSGKIRMPVAVECTFLTEGARLLDEAQAQIEAQTLVIPKLFP